MKGFKTIIFNIIASILPMLEAADITNTMNMNDSWSAAYGGIVAGVNIYLRSKTTTPVFRNR